MAQNNSSLSRSTIHHGLLPMTVVPALNLLCLLFMFYTISPFIIQPTTAQVDLPKTIPSDRIPERTITIALTGEDLIYFEDHVVSDAELKRILNATALKDHPILIKVDRRSSLGRVLDIWNVCREHGAKRVNIATPINK